MMLHVFLSAMSLLLVLSLSGCHWPMSVRDPEYAPVARAAISRSPTITSVAAAKLPIDNSLGNSTSIDDYIDHALAQNPDVQAKRKIVEARLHRIPQARSLEDPNLSVNGYPFYPHVQQNASGRMTAIVGVSQKVPWPGTLSKQGQVAEAEVVMAKADLAATELEIIEGVKRAYYELHYLQRAIGITDESKQLAKRFSQIAEARVRANAVSQQDYLRAELNVSQLDVELVRLRQEVQSSQARLARWLHVSPDTPLSTANGLPAEDVFASLDSLYEQAIENRPELHAQLAAIERDRHQVDLAKLKYFPDVTFGAGWEGMSQSRAIAPTADGIDNYTLSVMANIPIYWHRLDASVQEAEANAVASARQFDGLRDRTQEEVRDLFAQASSQRELLSLFQKSIIPKAQQTLEVSIPAYESGKVDFATLIENWQEVLRFRLSQERIDSQLRQTIASLERTVGGLGTPAVSDRVAASGAKNLEPVEITPADELGSPPEGHSPESSKGTSK
jgi:outer membrane protein TolC